MRPVSPLYADVSLAVSSTLSPASDIKDPQTTLDKLKERLAERARIEGAAVSTTAPTAAGAEVERDALRSGGAKPRMSERTRAERKLGWMLCAPAVVVMLAVTAYPILYAIWLSLHRSDLRFPDRTAWVGLDNYITVLSSNLWWKDLVHTMILTVLSVSVELVLGMLLALAMHRAIMGRGLIRTSALVPYGIVTVVAAFAWRLAFSKADGGFVPAVLNLQDDPLITRGRPT